MSVCNTWAEEIRKQGKNSKKWEHSPCSLMHFLWRMSINAPTGHSCPFSICPFSFKTAWGLCCEPPHGNGAEKRVNWRCLPLQGWRATTWRQEWMGREGNSWARFDTKDLWNYTEKEPHYERGPWIQNGLENGKLQVRKLSSTILKETGVCVPCFQLDGSAVRKKTRQISSRQLLHAPLFFCTICFSNWA